MIYEALNLVMLGKESYRSAARHLLIHDFKISHVAVYKWVEKYFALMREYLDANYPEYHEVWSTDEMMVNVKKTKRMGKGFYDWAWGIVAPQTKFVIATEVSKRRETKDARRIFQSGKSKSDADPSFEINDSLRSYDDAFRSEFDSRKTAHVKTKSFADGFENRGIERYWNEVKEYTKNKRGLGNDKSAQNFFDAHRTTHNYLRGHSGLPKCITPAEAAGIDLKLGNNKVKDLIIKSAEAKRDSNILSHLEKNPHIAVVREKDCIRVRANQGIDRKTWAEINEVLKNIGFGWLENGSDSEWMKMGCD